MEYVNRLNPGDTYPSFLGKKSITHLMSHITNVGYVHE